MKSYEDDKKVCLIKYPNLKWGNTENLANPTNEKRLTPIQHGLPLFTVWFALLDCKTYVPCTGIFQEEFGPVPKATGYHHLGFSPRAESLAHHQATKGLWVFLCVLHTCGNRSEGSVHWLERGTAYSEGQPYHRVCGDSKFRCTWSTLRKMPAYVNQQACVRSGLEKYCLEKCD